MIDYRALLHWVNANVTHSVEESVYYSISAIIIANSPS
jgi:hypothetical protein